MCEGNIKFIVFKRFKGTSDDLISISKLIETFSTQIQNTSNVILFEIQTVFALQIISEGPCTITVIHYDTVNTRCVTTQWGLNTKLHTVFARSTTSTLKFNTEVKYKTY